MLMKTDTGENALSPDLSAAHRLSSAELWPSWIGKDGSKISTEYFPWGLWNIKVWTFWQWKLKIKPQSFFLFMCVALPLNEGCLHFYEVRSEGGCPRGLSTVTLVFTKKHGRTYCFMAGLPLLHRSSQAMHERTASYVKRKYFTHSQQSTFQTLSAQLWAVSAGQRHRDNIVLYVDALLEMPEEAYGGRV